MPRASRSRTRRAALVGLLVAGLLATAAPATADPAGPTHFRSTITDVRADEDTAVPELEILGGDAFLVVRAVPGTEVEVPGYEGEPYVRISPDGNVEVNERSPAHYLNDARYGEADVEVPAIADADAPPTWTTVASGGEYAWHDHRIHFMSPVLPPSVDTTADVPQPMLDWTVPMLVDGAEVEVLGELSWVPGPSPIVPIGLTIVLVLAALAVALRWPERVWLLLLVGAVPAVGIGLSAVLGQPTGADGEFALVVLPVLTVGLIGLGRWLVGRDRATLGRVLEPAGGVPLVVWSVLLIGALTRPIVPIDAPVELVRVAVSLVLAAGVAGLVTAARAAVAATALDVGGEVPDGAAPGTRVADAG